MIRQVSLITLTIFCSFCSTSFVTSLDVSEISSKRMIWWEISDEFITRDDLLQPVSILFIDICDETSWEFSWMNAVESVVEKLLSSVFAWSSRVVIVSILFCEFAIQVKISSALRFREIVLSVVFDCEWVVAEWKFWSISRPFSESRRISIWRTSIILRFMSLFSSEFDFFSKLLRECSNLKEAQQSFEEYVKQSYLKNSSIHCRRWDVCKWSFFERIRKSSNVFDRSRVCVLLIYDLNLR